MSPRKVLEICFSKLHIIAIKYTMYTYTVNVCLVKSKGSRICSNTMTTTDCFFLVFNCFFISGFLRRHLWLAWHVTIAIKSFWLARNAKNASKFMQVFSLQLLMSSIFSICCFCHCEINLQTATAHQQHITSLILFASALCFA